MLMAASWRISVPSLSHFYMTYFRIVPAVLVVVVGHFMYLNLLYDLVAYFQLHGIVLDCAQA